MSCDRREQKDDEGWHQGQSGWSRSNVITAGKCRVPEDLDSEDKNHEHDVVETRKPVQRFRVQGCNMVSIS